MRIGNFQYKRDAFLLLVFSVILYGLSSSGQEPGKVIFERYSVEHYKLERGLSQNWVYCIHQDKNGYMWFGTWDGLNRFDGYDFTVYNEPDGVSNHAISALVEDDEGILWIGTEYGLNRFDRKTLLFTQYLHRQDDTASLVHNRVTSLANGPDGSLWIGTAGGLSRFDKKTGKFKSFMGNPQSSSGPRSNYILHITFDRYGILWISTTYGLVRLLPENQRTTRFFHTEGDDNSLSDNNIRCVFPEGEGNYWIGTAKGLNYYDGALQRITRYYHIPGDPGSLSDDFIRVIYSDKAGNLWIGTNNGGLNKLNRETGTFTVFRNQYNDETSLSDNKIYSIFEDRAGNLWVGTFLGLSRINRISNDFSHVRVTSEDDKSLNNNVVWAFHEDMDRRLWIATSGGINIYDPVTRRYSYLVHDPLNPNSLADNDARCIYYTPDDGCYWFGTYGSGFDRYYPATGKFAHYPRDLGTNSVSSNYINGFHLDDKGMLWIATGSGLNVMDPATGNFRVYRNDPGDPESLSNNVIICFLPSSDGETYWIGTNEGLNRFNPETGKAVRYLHNENDSTSISHNTVFVVMEDSNGNLWIGTSGGGLNMKSADNDGFVSYTTEDGLPNNIVYGILEDGQGNLWLSTNRGLSKFMVGSGRFINYDAKDKIQSNEFNLGAYYMNRSGRMFFGGMNGYNVFHPSDISNNPDTPVIVITSFKKFNEIQRRDYQDGDTIVLNHKENFFSFGFSALDFTNPAKNKYRYRLDNFDKNWTYAEGYDRVAEYRNVRPGTFRFRVTGSNNDGLWNNRGISVTIIITPPWYKTWFFRIIASLLLIFAIWSLFSRRIRKIKEKAEIDRKMFEIEKQLFDLEQKSLRLQMNPHFLFNSLNSIQSYILSHDTQSAILYLGKFAQLMRSILSHSSSKYISLKDELKAITQYLELEQLRFENMFDFDIVTDPGIDEEFVEIPPMIIQPYLENSIIHGLIGKQGKGRITIRFRLTGERIFCTIEDDGIGREKAMQNIKEKGLQTKSSGMLITQARLELLNSDQKDEYSVKVVDLKDENGQPCGTRVELFIAYREG